MRKVIKKTAIVFITLLIIAGIGLIVMFAHNDRLADIAGKDVEKDYFQVDYDDPAIDEELRGILKNDPTYGLPAQRGFIEEINDNEVVLAFGRAQKWDPSAHRQTFKFTDDTMYLDIKEGQVIESFDDFDTLSWKDFKVDDCVNITFNKLPNGGFWVVAIEHFDEALYTGGICDPLFSDPKEVTSENLEFLLEKSGLTWLMKAVRGFCEK